MYTHDLAEALRKLATLLKRGPNIPLGEITDLVETISSGRRTQHRHSTSDTSAALNALLSFSSIDKSEWIDLIEDLRLPIEIRPRDAARDIMGKVIRHMEANPDHRKRLEMRAKNRDGRASPELARALSSLLGK